MRKILDFWPMESPPRKSQIETLEWIEKLPANIKYVLCELPVGAGKSPLGVNVSAWLKQSLGDAFILTPQRILQKQYEESFDSKYIGSLYGKVNYECKGKQTNCDIGSTIAPACSNCPHKAAAERAHAAPNLVLNYSLALLLFKYHPDLRTRKLMVFDECHTLEHHLTEFNAVSFSEMRCKKIGIALPPVKTIIEALDWLGEKYSPALMKLVQKLGDEVLDLTRELKYTPRPLTKDEQHTLSSYKELKEHLINTENLLLMQVQDVQERYVLITEKTSFRFKELYGKNVFHSLVKPMADIFLFLSSTILNKEDFCKDLGLNPDEAAFISLDSEFEVDNRPVMYIPQMKMNYEWSQDKNREGRQNMLLKIKEICEMHENESGIIHTASFQIASWLVEELSLIVKHDIMHHNPGMKMNRDTVINEYLRVAPKRPTLLISPSITEGLDLKDDLGRFCIFIKVPYPNMGDAWVKRRMDISNSWYQRQAMISIIQGAGRVTRSKSDWGNTFILDSSFNFLYYNMNKYIPNWWKEGYQKL